MPSIRRFEDILSWQAARQLNSKIATLIHAGRFKSSYRLISQIESSAGSIMDNIAEGFERSGNREFIQFLYIAKGSCGELRSQLYRALDYGYIARSEFDELSAEARVSSLIQKLISYLQTAEIAGAKYKNRIGKAPTGVQTAQTLETTETLENLQQPKLS